MDGHAAAGLLAELGIVRAASAFEDYLQGVIAELDRANIPARNINADLIERVLVRLSFESPNRPSLDLVRFFDCARNCIVHQMGRANAELVDRSVAKGLADALANSTPRAKAKWKPKIPATSLGKPVTWRPRHAILASDAYYKAAVAIDKRLRTVLGDGRLVAMAAYWAVTAPIPVVEARSSLIATLRSALNDRYRVKVKATRPLQPIRKDLMIRFLEGITTEAIMAAREVSVKKYVVRLSADERERLEALIRKGKSPAQRLLKARILLKADVSEAGEGWSDSRIIAALETSPSMVYRVRKQLVEEGFEAVLSRKQRATPAVARIFDGEKEAKLIALACSKPPKGRARWTLRLLESKVVELHIVDRASNSTIGRALKKTLFSPIADSAGSSRPRPTAPS